MMRTRRFAFVLAAMMPLAAHAQHVGNNNGIWWIEAPAQPDAFTVLNPLSTGYGRLGFLYSWPRQPTAQFLNASVATRIPSGFGGVLGWGARFMPILRLELQASGTFNVIATAGTPPVGFNGRMRFSSVQVLTNAYLDIAPLFADRLAAFNPYLFGGIGLAHTTLGDATRSVIVDDPGDGAPFITVLSPGSGRSRIGFAWNAGAGIQYQPMRHLILDLAYRYLDAGPFPTAALNSGASFNLTGHYTAHQLMFSILVPFDGLAGMLR